MELVGEMMLTLILSYQPIYIGIDSGLLWLIMWAGSGGTSMDRYKEPWDR
jgi:hypothetical protein